MDCRRLVQIYSLFGVVCWAALNLGCAPLAIDSPYASGSSSPWPSRTDDIFGAV
jgi:hypothetical protein